MVQWLKVEHGGLNQYFFIFQVFLPYRTERDQFARVHRRALRWFCWNYLNILDDTFKEAEIDSFQELNKSGLLLNNILCTL